MLNDLQKQFPLPHGWSLVESFSDVFELGNLSVDRVGVAAQRADGAVVTGSASGASAALRAHFELLERIAVKDFIDQVHFELPVFDSSGVVRGTTTQKDLFLSTPEPAVFQYAKSNGIALYTDLPGACSRAAFELIERDRIIRSWYGGDQPVKLSSSVLEDWPAFPVLTELYEVRVYLFEDRRDASMANVVGVFCFPKSPEHVFSFGFGAAETPEAACLHAREECLQRISFLWGQAFDAAPVFSPTPMYHQEVFLTPEGMKRVRRWLNGEHETFLTRGRLEFHWSLAQDEVHFVEITPDHFKGTMHLVKAISPQRLPLIFGKGYQDQFPDVEAELRIHPIA